MPQDSSWRRFRIWFPLATIILLFGGLSARGLMALMNQTPLDLGWSAFVWPLIVFSLGGGLTVGALIVAWGVADGNPFVRAVSLGAFLVLLFALFVWPTPYKYYRDDDLKFVVKINRLTGDIAYTPKP